MNCAGLVRGKVGEGGGTYGKEEFGEELPHINWHYREISFNWMGCFSGVRGNTFKETCVW